MTSRLKAKTVNIQEYFSSDKIIVLSFLFLSVLIIWNVNLVMLLKLVAVCLIVGYSFHNPLPALFIFMVIRTNVFQLVSLERLPYFQMGSGLRINASDAFILLFLVIAFHRFYKAKERPLFLNLVIIWIVLVGVSFGAGLLLGDSDLDTGMNLIRYQIGYLSYFFMISLLDTYKRFRQYVKFLIIIVGRYWGGNQCLL